jgi:hypothetical protein
MWIECAKPGSKGGGECGRWLVRFFTSKISKSAQRAQRALSRDKPRRGDISVECIENQVLATKKMHIECAKPGSKGGGG